MLRVLVGIPYHPSKRYALGHVMDWIEKQHQPGVEILMPCDPYGGVDAIKKQMERLRLYAKQGGYDYLYIMEADTIPPLDALTKLINRATDVVGALYYYRDPPHEAVAWRQDDPNKAFLHSEASLVEVDGMGTGAVLLHSKVLNAFNFFEWGVPDADYPMYDLLRERGFTIWLDKSIVCKHYSTEDKWA